MSDGNQDRRSFEKEVVDQVGDFALLVQAGCDSVTARAYAGDLIDALELHPDRFRRISQEVANGVVTTTVEWKGSGQYLDDIRKDLFVVLSELTAPMLFLRYSRDGTLLFTVICASTRESGYAVALKICIVGSAIEKILKNVDSLQMGTGS